MKTEVSSASGRYRVGEWRGGTRNLAELVEITAGASVREAIGRKEVEDNDQNGGEKDAR